MKGYRRVDSRLHIQTDSTDESFKQRYDMNKGVFCKVGFPGDSDGKESACSAGDLGSKRPLEKGMAAHSSILAWRIPWTEEPDGLRACGPRGHKEVDMTE